MYEILILSYNQFLAACKERLVMSDSLELVDFAIRLVNFVFNLPDRQVIFFEQLE